MSRTIITPPRAQRWDPFSVLSRVDREFDEIMRQVAPPTSRQASFVPAAEILRQGSDALITLELPGLSPENVSIELERGQLVVAGERTSAAERENDALLVREMRYGSFRRSFSLPQHVTGEAISATYDAGLLHITVAGVWQPEPEPVRVQIQVGRPEGKPSAITEDGEPAT